ncbi:MAG: hypothetical protein ABFS45_27630 [Pseudomonadota bacterium]
MHSALTHLRYELLVCSQIFTAVLVVHISVQMVGHFWMQFNILKALKREGIIDKMPTPNRDWAAVQQAIDAWHSESGHTLTEISQILAYSVE